MDCARCPYSTKSKAARHRRLSDNLPSPMTKTLKNRGRTLLLAAASALLAGCFESEQPKFPLASAAAPFGEGGRYVVYERVANDQFQRQEVFVIKRRPDRAYDFVNEKSEVIAISLHAIGGDLFA